MQQQFWQARWQSGRTGFHRSEVNDALVSFGAHVFGHEPVRILVPLCGMTLDLDWLVHQGHQVVGVEFVPEAVAQLKERMGEPVSVTELGAGLVEWRWSDRFSVLQGDLFRLGELSLTPFDGIWDRAAIVALDPTTRRAYAKVLLQHLKPGGAILMRTFAYDQSVMEGPPFSVTEDDLRVLFQGVTVSSLASESSEPDEKFQERGLTWQRVETFCLR